MWNQDVPPFEHMKMVFDGFKNVMRDLTKDMQKYEPLIFEDCFVKDVGPTKMMSSFDLEKHKEIKQKADPSNGQVKYKGFHLFVLCHGFHGNSFDVRNFKNVISVVLPDALILSSEANEENSDMDIYTMGHKLAEEIRFFIKENCPGS